MATKLEPEFPSSPPNDESDGGEQEESLETELEDSPEGQLDIEKEEPVFKKPVNNNVANILKRLQSTGALLKKPKQEYYCFTCKKEYPTWEELETHLITHVSLPSLILDKLQSDDEDAPQSGEDDWSDEEEEAPTPTKTPPRTPQKIEISQLLKNTGLSLKNPSDLPKSSDSALDKLSGLGFTIKKSTTPIKKEPEPDKNTSDVMQKLGKLGGLKLKIKCEGNNSSNFKVVNGLKDFKTESDEDDEKSEDDNEKSAENPDVESDEEQDKLGEHEQEESEADNDSDDEKSLASRNTLDKAKIANLLKNLQGKTVAKIEVKSPVKPAAAIIRTPSKDVPPAKPIGRPSMKQTPKRGANLPFPSKEGPKITEISTSSMSSNSTPERRQSHDRNMDNVVVKTEVETVESQSASNAPLFSPHVKTERSSPPLESVATPVITTVKTESEPLSMQHHAQPLFSNQTNRSAPITTPLLPVTKTEDSGVTIIEINGDSNDEDDDCCVVSATPAPDVKPVVPKIEPVSRIEQVNYPTPAYPTTTPTSNFTVSPNSTYPITSSYGNSLPRGSSLEKNHSFNWNAPDSKPPIDMLEKSAEDIFESLLSNTPKKEGFSMSDASEYISLDTLGPQHTCDVCNTRFTSISLLDDHMRITGHSKSLVTPTSSTLLPYNPGGTSSILQSLLPVKQMVEQVGKMTGMGGPGFTHQQNVMINIQAYPGAGGVMPQQGAYNAYGQQNVPPGYNQPPNSMYGAQQQQMPGQYPNQPYGANMGQPGYGQFQNSMPKPGYPPNSFDSSPFSTASPLQSMQQSVYGQPGMNSQLGQMGPPPAPHSNQYVPTSNAGMMKPPITTSSGVRIQNIQTFPPGQMLGMQGHQGSDASAQPLAPGQVVGGQMPSPGQLRMASGVTGPRPRMPNVRGQRPTIRPGVQVHGQIRGNKPGMRMPMKRPGMPGGPGGPAMKKRPTMLLPGKHDNEDCQVMALQKQREGMPMIQSVQGAKDKLNLGSQISITKKVVNKEASAMANILATRGISVKQKQKSRSPSPERPVPHIPNLGAGVSIKHTSRASNFSIPEAKVGGGMLSCKVCNKMFMNQNSLSAHMSTAHPSSKLPMFRCEECPAAYPKILQLQHHKRVFHNVVGPNRELGLPVVDMSQEDNLKRLSSLGIYSFIPLAGKDGSAGCFGLPIISVHNVQNGMTKHLQALGAEGLLSLGPLKQLPNT